MLKPSQYAKWVVISAVVILGAACSARTTTTTTESAPVSEATAPTNTTQASQPTAPTNTTQVSETTAPIANAPLDADKAEGIVENALEADTTLKPFDLDVDENNGGIKIKGTVQTATQRALAEQIAKQNAPGISVVNQIAVAATASATNRSATVDADKAEDLVSDALKANATLKPLNIDADEENGGILLKGTVQTAAQKTLAENLAKQAAPGFSITNQIRVVQ